MFIIISMIKLHGKADRAEPAETGMEGETPMDASIQKYQAFVRTVELGSFTKAAESLSYSQSGVSRMVADL